LAADFVIFKGGGFYDMKRKAFTGLLFMCVISLSAQIRNGQNLKLYSWTKNGQETGMVEQVGSAVVQTNGNEIKYTLRTKNSGLIVIEFNRVTKRLHYKTEPDNLLSVTGSFSESGSTSIFSFTDDQGGAHILKFRRI
jgi:hypothetical protein